MTSQFRASICVALLASFGLISSLGTQVAAQQPPAPTDPSASLAPFLSDDTFFVAAVDLDKVDPPASLSALATLLNVPAPEQQQANVVAVMVKSVLDGLRGAGVRHIFVIGGLGDIHARGGPIAVMSTQPTTVDAVQAQIQTLVTTVDAALGIPGQPAVKFQRHSSGTLLIGSTASIDRYAAQTAGARPDLATPLARLLADGASIAAVAAPGKDARRVLRELWPTLPPPATALDATMISERMKHFELALKLAANPSAHLAIETTDEESAEKLLRTADQVGPALSHPNANETARLMRLSLEALNPRVEGTRLVGSLSAETLRQNNFGAMFAEAIDKSRESARMNMRLSTIRQITVAFFSYESSKKVFPPAAIREAQGRALLSWRVAVLPYMGPREAELYKLFHLDEPWDSPHNRTLLARMPELFSDPDPKLAGLKREGKTTYQVPVGPETIFYKNEGTQLREITDGTSHTILVVEVVPERAVEWTKPADWEVDMQNPLVGVKRTDRKAFVTGWADGHAEAIRNDMDPQDFRVFLTRAGGSNEPLPKH